MSGLLNLLHHYCRKGKHLYWPPHYVSKRCLLCGKFEMLHAGGHSVTITDDKITFSAATTTGAKGDLWLDPSDGLPYVNIGASSTYDRSLVHQTTQGHWTHVETKTISSSTASTTFTGLSGDDVKAYMLEGKVVLVGANPLYLLPNGSTTHCASCCIFCDDNTGSDVTTAAAWILYAGNDSVDTLTFQIILHPDSATDRTYAGYSGGLGGTGYTTCCTVGGSWSDHATEITSLEVAGESNLDAGSVISLYSMGQE